MDLVDPTLEKDPLRVVKNKDLDGVRRAKDMDEMPEI